MASIWRRFTTKKPNTFKKHLKVSPPLKQSITCQWIWKIKWMDNYLITKLKKRKKYSINLKKDRFPLFRKGIALFLLFKSLRIKQFSAKYTEKYCLLYLI